LAEMLPTVEGTLNSAHCNGLNCSVNALTLFSTHVIFVV